MVWKSAGDAVDRKYDFMYDPVNRLAGAAYLDNHNGSGWEVNVKAQRNATTQEMKDGVQNGDDSKMMKPVNATILQVQFTVNSNMPDKPGGIAADRIIPAGTLPKPGEGQSIQLPSGSLPKNVKTYPDATGNRYPLTDNHGNIVPQNQ